MKCPCCGEREELFSGYFDADDLATDDDSGEGTRWTTWCQKCGTEVPAPRSSSRRTSG
jgi:hypothetical protein